MRAHTDSPGVQKQSAVRGFGLINKTAREFSKESQEPRGLKKLGLTGRTALAVCASFPMGVSQ